MRPSLLPNGTVPKAARTERASSPGDLATWLTNDLRAKGAPSSAPPAAEVHVERLTPAPAVLVVAEPELDAEQAAFATWLASDLRPRRSHPPDSLASQLVPPDSLAPQLVPPAATPVATEVVPDLDADDLAVLPGRARSRGPQSARRRRVAALLALLACGLGAAWLWPGRSDTLPLESAAAALPAAPLGALPPPPPSELPLEPEPEPVPTPGGVRSWRAVEEPPPEPDDPWSGPRGRSWARYADLPSPTLSRLAREERELAKKRDEERRSAAKRKKSAQ